MVIHKGFSPRSFSYQHPWWGVCKYYVTALKGKNVGFPNCRENQVNGNSTRTKKLQLQYKVAVKLPLRRIQFVRVISATVQFILLNIFSFTSSLHVFFSVTLPCINFPPPPHQLSNGPSLNALNIQNWFCWNWPFMSFQISGVGKEEIRLCIYRHPNYNFFETLSFDKGANNY